MTLVNICVVCDCQPQHVVNLAGAQKCRVHKLHKNIAVVLPGLLIEN